MLVRPSVPKKQRPNYGTDFSKTGMACLTKLRLTLSILIYFDSDET